MLIRIALGGELIVSNTPVPTITYSSNGFIDLRTAHILHARQRDQRSVCNSGLDVRESAWCLYTAF